jgi:gliding motility-associated-like protein
VNDGQAESNIFDLKIDVKKAPNVAPQITGQSPLNIDQGESVTITFNNLNVTDPDNQYPNGFSLKVFGGPNYTSNGTTITPSADFSGTLTVPVSVNDGQAESNRFDLKIEVKKAQNVAPKITGQSPLSINEGESLTLEFSHLKVTDPDNQYPNGFTLKIYEGPNHIFNETTITPSADFSGALTVPVSVNDGQAESNKYNLKIDIKKAVNVAPVITGQQTATVKEDEQFVLKLSHITVTDTDDSPDNFTLKIFPGTNYSVDGFTISPSKNFSGLLLVPIRVSDGKSDSEPFDFRLNVEPANDPATVIGQVELQTPMNSVIEIDISHLKIDDPDNTDTGNFSIKLFSGPNYSVAGQVVVPEVGFTGILTVPVTVDDGNGPGPQYSLKINVTPVAPNKPPVITGQKPIAITPNSSIEIQLSHLTVNDEDDKYPFGFSLKLFPGDGYSLSNTTITVDPDVLNGNLTVPVVVNDGEDNSPTFLLKVQVLPVTSKPRIIGQRELAVPEDSTLVLKLTDLIVADADNLRYPEGFVLIVLPGNPALYSREGNTIRPGHNLNGFIEVGVIVSDGVNASDEFPLVVLVTPVNDPPEFIHGVATPLAYQPGQQPILISETVSITDVDSDNLIMAEIGFSSENFSMKNDILDLPEKETSLRVIRNAEGILFLIGPGSLDDYAKALSSIQYYYQLTEDETRDPDEILAGSRTIYMKVFDGEANSLPYEIEIRMQVEVQLDIPNAFTPNGDNNNDTWSVRILNGSNVDNAVIRVYDRRGRLLYEAIGLEKSWDGMVNGQLLPVDTYFYTIDLNLTYMQTSHRGVVTILH